MLYERFAYPTVMRFFEEISAIPRASYKEARIADYLVSFAKERGLSWYRDEANNVLIECAATPDCADRAPVLLQGHTDMVCEKNEGVAHDFDRDPLDLYEEDGWIRARGTTLGADNGVAVAMMLALLDGMAESHPALQCLFTSSEEIGMDGAMAFDYDRIYARRMINMDSADESCIIAGCAGGLRSQIALPLNRMACELPAMQLCVSGLFGGHSGEDVHRGRANANKILGRVLWELLKTYPELKLVSANGGSKDNAIPREAKAIFRVECPERVAQTVAALETVIRGELVRDDSRFRLSVETFDTAAEAIDAKGTQALIFLLETVANGVFSMNRELPNLVEFSRNLGVLTTEDAEAKMIFSSRSALNSQIDRSVSELDAYASLLGASIRHYNRYPGWNFESESPFRDLYFSSYRKLFGKDPTIEVIHAGLECGLIKEKLPDMDLFSCGPIITDLHSPDEALNLASFERFVTIILDLMKNC